MNRLTIFLLAGVTVLLSGVAGRHSLDNVAATPRPLPNVRESGAPVPTFVPTAVAAHPAVPAAVEATAVQRKAADAAKIRSSVKSAKHLPSGETPDDYVYVKPAAVRTAAANRVESRDAYATTSVRPVVAPARKAASSSAATPGYKKAVAEAESLGANDLNRAARRLELITSEDPDRPEAYEKLAAIRLQLGDYYQAYEMYASAVRAGGTASFSVMHDHARGNFNSNAKDTCAGKLNILPDRLTFQGTEHSFAVSWAELLEAGANRFFGSGIGGFHVKVGADKKARNFNLAPRSKDKRETDLILDLLIDSAEAK